MRSTFTTLATAAIAASQLVGALNFNKQDSNSVKTAAQTVAKDLWSNYKGNTDQSQLGLLPKPYYWWEAGAMFGSMISYSYLTGDKQFDGDVAQAIFSQASPTNDFMKLDTQAFDLGNDDQGFWALTAMSAAEHNLPPPSGQPDDIWLTLASGAFNDLIGRWNTTFCGGGIKWQFLTANNGFNYKSSIANGVTMQLGARLALLTGNQTYADKATMIYDWMTAIGYISPSFQVFDGAGDDPDNCTKIDRHEWSYNSGAVLGAAAALASYTAAAGHSDAKAWADRTSGLWQHASQNFFKNGVLYEQPCEDVGTSGTCNNDQWSFKAYLARWATFASQIVPAISGDVQRALSSTADAIAKSCTGNGASACGTKWYNGNYNGITGVGQEMSALEVLVGLLAPNVPFVPGGKGQSTPASSSTPTPTPTPVPATSSTPVPATPTTIVPTTMATSVIPASSAPAPPPAPVNSSTPTPTANQGAAQSSQVANASSSAGPVPVRIGNDGIPFWPVYNNA